jgi:hypothetical protein
MHRTRLLELSFIILRALGIFFLGDFNKSFTNSTCSLVGFSVKKKGRPLSKTQPKLGAQKTASAVALAFFFSVKKREKQARRPLCTKKRKLTNRFRDENGFGIFWNFGNRYRFFPIGIVGIGISRSRSSEF